MRKIIIDTDIGENIDDTWSLLSFLSCNFFEVSLISITNGDIEYKTKIVAKILTLLNKTHIPIVKGKESNGERRIYPQREWVEDFNIDLYEGTIFDSYEKGYRTLLSNSNNEHTLVALAPFTSLADITYLLERYKVDVVAMSGSIYKGYLGSDFPEAECNIVTDIVAAKRVLSSKLKIVLLPLDVCRGLVIDGYNYELIKNSKNAHSKIALENYYIWQKNYKGRTIKLDIEHSTSVLSDMIPFLYLMYPQNFEVKYLPITITEDGYTKIGGQKEILVALGMSKKRLMIRLASEIFANDSTDSYDYRVIELEDVYKLIFPQRRNNIFLSVCEVGWENKNPGEEVGPSTRDYYILHLITQGKGKLFVEDLAFDLKQGDCFLIPPNMISHYIADKEDPYSYYWVGFTGLEAPEMLKKSGYIKNHLYVTRPQKYDSILKRMVNMTNSESKDSRIEYLLIGELYLIFADMITNENANGRELSYVDLTMLYIKNNYRKFITVNDIAKHIGVDRTYLFRIFKAETGMSIQDYLINLRIDNAKILLTNTNKLVKEISSMIGYASDSTFINAFKKKCNVSPSEYRKQNKSCKLIDGEENV